MNVKGRAENIVPERKKEKEKEQKLLEMALSTFYASKPVNMLHIKLKCLLAGKHALERVKVVHSRREIAS